MLVLGIESTCDETACAVVEGEKTILSNVIASQTALHAPFGGVFPELASRQHIEVFPEVLQQALKEANTSLEKLDLIAVAEKPGLMGSLLVGIHFAKGLALGANIPLIGVDHVEAHLFSAYMSATEEILFPAIGLVVSGGHTLLVYMSELGSHQIIGRTRDDALGEAFDKVATLLSLPYPGGPLIEQLAKKGDPQRYRFKVGQIKERPLDFSFSGLKTSVLYQVKGQNAHSTPLLSDQEKCDIAASFQRVAFADIISKTLLAVKEFGCKSILIGGGVSNSSILRDLFFQVSPIPLYFPHKALTQDNGAMIAGLGSYLFSLENKLKVVN